MKKCERCGASNAERARFCSNCAEPFADVVVSQALAPVAPSSAASSEPSNATLLPARVDASTRSNVPRVDSADDLYRALGTIAGALGRVFAFLFGRFFVFLGRCAVGLWRASETPRTHFASGASRLGRDSLRAFALIFTPTTRWPTNAPPNFLAPSLVFFFLWTRPFALAAVVYSILANETQKNGDGGVARRQAAAARNWIFIELLFVAAKALVEAFGLSLPLLKKLFF